jgi:hypothetical protein
MSTLRTKKTEDKYERYKKNKKSHALCPLCTDKALKSFKYWKILRALFPYNRIAKRHHMIVSIRHVKENKLNQKELMELKNIKKNFINKKGGYHYIMEAVQKHKTIPDHFHLHLITLK